MKNEVLTLAEASARIVSGEILSIAGHPAYLAQLPKGTWIGGSSHYFVTSEGGKKIENRLYCTSFDEAEAAEIRVIAPDNLTDIATGYQTGGASLILIPAFGHAHRRFAIEAPQNPALFAQPLMGWVAGTALERIGQDRASVIDGSTGQSYEDAAIVMHLGFAKGVTPNLEIVNIFEQAGDTATSIIFETSGFEAEDAMINGAKQNLARYLTAQNWDARLPLIANYGGAHLNVSIKSVDADTGIVSFYAPVQEGVVYRPAAALPDDYAQAFAASLSDKVTGADYSCNCILNYLYGEMEGKSVSGFTGPMTFGEIAYMLLNQTLVRLELQKAA